MIKDLKQTASLMESADYKERFKAEYLQLKIRTQKLNDFCNRIEAAQTCDKVLAPEHDCSYPILVQQLRAMERYLHILEVRAVMENIDLNPDPTVKE